MNKRQIDLYKLGFEANIDQRCFYMWKFDNSPS